MDVWKNGYDHFSIQQYHYEGHSGVAEDNYSSEEK